MLRLVLDTDVIVAAMRSPAGASAALLNAADSGVIKLLASVALAIEYEAQCTNPTHWTAAGITRQEAEIFADAVISMVEEVKIHFLWRPQLNDAGDEMVLEAAINGKADAVVTFNIRDFGDAPDRFGMKIMRPSEAIRRIKI